LQAEESTEDGLDVALTVIHVSKTFPGQKALDDVSLTVRAGEVHALLGENGSGKSTLIKILAGIYLPDPGGDVLIRGERLPVGSPAASFELGLRFVHQKLGVIHEMNAVENIALEAGFARKGFIDWDEQERITRRLLGRLNVEMDVWAPLRDCKPVERSAVAIARALRTDALDGALVGTDVPVVILDEPTSALPAAEVRQLFRVVRDLTSGGVAVIYVSHRLDEVFEIADSVSVLRDGRLRATESLANLTREDLVRLIVGRDLASSWDRPVRNPHDTASSVALRVRGLSGERLDDVSFDVNKGEIVGVVGVAGSGRESMARTLSGAIPPVAGELIIDGSTLPMITPRQTTRHGLMLALGNTQPSSAIGAFSVHENLTLPALRRYAPFGRLQRRSETAAASSWMDSLDIRPRDPHRLYSLLSGGNQQKVILGKWLNADPKVLVLDEPTAGVDVGARQAIYGLIADQVERGLGVVLCSSDLEDVVSLCDRTLVIRDGAIAAELTGDEMTEHNLLLQSVGAVALASGAGAV
jgi:ribose transport system ATP-binding protein